MEIRKKIFQHNLALKIKNVFKKVGNPDLVRHHRFQASREIFELCALLVNLDSLTIILRSRSISNYWYHYQPPTEEQVNIKLLVPLPILRSRSILNY